MNSFLAFLKGHKLAILVIVLLVTPLVSWTWVALRAIFGLVNWVGVLVSAAFFAGRATKRSL